MHSGGSGDKLDQPPDEDRYDKLDRVLRTADTNWMELHLKLQDVQRLVNDNYLVKASFFIRNSWNAWFQNQEDHNKAVWGRRIRPWLSDVRGLGETREGYTTSDFLQAERAALDQPGSEPSADKMTQWKAAAAAFLQRKRREVLPREKWRFSRKAAFSTKTAHIRQFVDDLPSIPDTAFPGLESDPPILTEEEEASIRRHEIELEEYLQEIQREKAPDKLADKLRAGPKQLPTTIFKDAKKNPAAGIKPVLRGVAQTTIRPPSKAVYLPVEPEEPPPQEAQPPLTPEKEEAMEPAAPPMSTVSVPSVFPACSHATTRMRFAANAPYRDLIAAFKGCDIRVTGALAIPLSEAVSVGKVSSTAAPAAIIDALAQELGGGPRVLRLHETAADEPGSPDRQLVGASAFVETKDTVAESPNRVILCMQTVIGPATMEEAARSLPAGQAATVLELARKLRAMIRTATNQTQQRARAAEEALGLTPGATTPAGSKTSIATLIPGDAGRGYDGTFSIVPPLGSAASDRFSLSVQNDISIRTDIGPGVVEIEIGMHKFSAQSGVGQLTVVAEHERFPAGDAVGLTYVLDPAAQRFVPRGGGHHRSQTHTPTWTHPRAPSVLGDTRGGGVAAAGDTVQVCPICAVAAARKFLVQQKAAMYAEDEPAQLNPSDENWPYFPWRGLVQMRVRDL